MVPYYGLLIFAVVFGIVFCELKKSDKRNLIYVAVLGVMMVLMAAFRAPSVGIDTQPYLDYFSACFGQGWSFVFDRANLYWKEPGYTVLNLLISWVTQSPRLFLGITSGLIIIMRLVFICKNSSMIWVSVVVYISFGFFSYSMCTLRQELAISIFMLFIPYLMNRRFLPYALGTLLAATFHLSVLICLPIYFIVHLPLKKWLLGLYCGATLAVLMVSETAIGFVTRFIYKDYQPGSYYMMGRDYNTAFFPILFLVLAVLLYRKLVSQNKHNVVLVNICCYAALLFALTVKHFIFQRIALLFLPILILLIPEIIRCAAPDEAIREQIEQMKQIEAHRKKQQTGKLGAAKAELKNQKSLYYTVMGLVLAGGAIYFTFLLASNRLGLVPYTIF